MLCEKCSNIHFCRLADCDLIKQEPDRLLEKETAYNLSGCVFYIHHKSKDALQNSNNNGCHFCAMLLDRLFGEHGSSKGFAKYAFARGEVILRREVNRRWINGDNGFERWNTGDWIYVQCEDRNITSQCHGDYSGLLGRTLDALTDCQSATTPESQRSSRPVPALLSDFEDIGKAELGGIPSELLHMDVCLYSPWLDVSTISLPNMLLASFWLQSCMLKHKVCIDFQKRGHLPNRIIDISDPQNPILDDGSDREEPYITLSYKWGEAHRYVTTAETLERHRKQGIPLSELPQTFKDAIFVASFLGFRWIWIDALCICQDKPDELMQEVNRMDQTFRTSTLTIFAIAGEGVDTGLMSMRDPRWLKPCKLTIRTTLEDNTAEGSAYFTLVGGEATYAPLYNRGWVLQEQVLAHRGLIFESRQIRWRCLCGSASEASPSATSYRTVDTVQDLGSLQDDRYIHYPTGYDGFNHLRMWIQQENAMPNRTTWQRDNQYDAWYLMVTNYNVRALSYETDVLFALAGLARAIATTHRCTYFAGLWKEDLQSGLCWYVTGSNFRNYDVQVTINELLPTWTWISQRGREIRFHGWENNHDIIKHEGIYLVEHYLSPQSNTIEPETSFTSITPKELMVTGRIRKIAVGWQYSGPERHGDLSGARWLLPVGDITTDENLGYIAFDSDPVNFTTCHIFCLLCIAREKYGEWQLTCLGLVPTDETLEEFKRIGLIVLRKKDWLGELQLFDLYDENIPWLRYRSKDTRFYRTVRLV